jgi:hypothetical protein
MQKLCQREKQNNMSAREHKRQDPQNIQSTWILHSPLLTAPVKLTSHMK